MITMGETTRHVWVNDTTNISRVSKGQPIICDCIALICLHDSEILKTIFLALFRAANVIYSYWSANRFSDTHINDDFRYN